MNIQKTPFADNLRRARKEKGYTQESLAEKLEIQLRRYQSWEEGRAEPRYTHLTKIAEALQVDDLYLFLSRELVEN